MYIRLKKKNNEWTTYNRDMKKRVRVVFTCPPPEVDCEGYYLIKTSDNEVSSDSTVIIKAYESIRQIEYKTVVFEVKTDEDGYRYAINDEGKMLVIFRRTEEYGGGWLPELPESDGKYSINTDARNICYASKIDRVLIYIRQERLKSVDA